MSKKDIILELLDGYKQLDSFKQNRCESCKSAKITLELYIKRLELKLKQLL